MAVPVPHTWTAGDNATSTAMQTLTDTGLWNLGSATSTGSKRPTFIGFQTIAQSIANTTWTSITLDSETGGVDYDNGHSTVTNTSRYTANTAGWHLVSGEVAFVSNATGQRIARWTVNGTAITGSEVPVAANSAGATGVSLPARLVYLNVGDYLEMQGYQSSTAALNTSTSTAGSHMTVLWVSN